MSCVELGDGLKIKKITQLDLDKKSNYLINLPKKKIEGIKKIEAQKASFIINKILKKDEFYRDYAFFSPSKNKLSFSTDRKRIFNPFDLKFLIVSPLEKICPNKYKKKDYSIDSFSKMFKNEKGQLFRNTKLPNSIKNNKKKNVITIPNDSNLCLSINKCESSILSKAGNLIINTQNNQKTPVSNSELQTIKSEPYCFSSNVILTKLKKIKE